MTNFFQKLLFLFFAIFLISCKSNSDEENTNLIEKIEKPINSVSYSDVKINDLEKWSVWTRESNVSAFKIVNKKIDSSDYKAFYFKHWGTKDFSITFGEKFSVQKGECYLISANVNVLKGELTSSFVSRDSDGNVISWTEGMASAKTSSNYQALYSIFMVSSDIATVQPRFIGTGECEVNLINVSIQKINLPQYLETIEIENSVLKVECDTKTASFTITDKRIGKTYLQEKSSINKATVIKTTFNDNEINLQAVNIKERYTVFYKAAFSKNDEATIEYSVNVKNTDSGSSSIKLGQNINFPQKNLTQSDDYLVLPINEGMYFDATDEGMPTTTYSTYSGHGLCMPFYGITSSKSGAGFINIIKTPDDSAVNLNRKDGLNIVGIVWQHQKNLFSYERKVSQTFLKNGNHVSIAKKYREYAKEKGLLVTFDEKKALRGQKGAENIDKLLGSANIWSYFSGTKTCSVDSLAKKMIDSGIDKILWSNQQSAQIVEKMNELGILTSAYDIYQDVMNPKNYDLVKYIHSCWIPESYPQDIALNEDGSMVQAWGVEKKQGEGYIYCSALCDMTAPKYARKRITEDLSKKNYGSRFLDTTTASSLRQCYSSSHSMTRTQSKNKRYELLGIVSNEKKLVCGSETGMDFCVPVCDYFEGMLSLGPYRIENSGRNCSNLIDDAPEQITNYQLNEKRRLPLWELVYHDCCVAMWYWGDNNNKISSVWDKRDLFNALYAVPPMYWILSEEYFDTNKDKIVKSYKKSSDIVKKTAGVEMVSHEFVSSDKSIQKTTFANGVTVTVNFKTGTITN